MVVRIVKRSLLVLVLFGFLIPATAVSDDLDRQRIQQLENRVQQLEKQTKGLESLLIEFADELALLNVKVTELEKRASVPATK